MLEKVYLLSQSTTKTKLNKTKCKLNLLIEQIDHMFEDIHLLMEHQVLKNVHQKNLIVEQCIFPEVSYPSQQVP